MDYLDDDKDLPFLIPVCDVGDVLDVECVTKSQGDFLTAYSNLTTQESDEYTLLQTTFVRQLLVKGLTSGEATTLAVDFVDASQEVNTRYTALYGTLEQDYTVLLKGTCCSTPA